MYQSKDGRDFTHIKPAPDPTLDIVTTIFPITGYDEEIRELQGELRRADECYVAGGNPHITGLSVYAKPKVLADADREAVDIYTIEGVEKAYSGAEPFRLELCICRPGLWTQDGAVVRLVGDPRVLVGASAESSLEFRDRAHRLRELLVPRLKSLGITVPNPLGGVWWTAGRFACTRPIPIDGKLLQAFKKLEGWRLTVTLDTLVICEAKRKSLEDARPIHRIKLGTKGGSRETR